MLLVKCRKIFDNFFVVKKKKIEVFKFKIIFGLEFRIEDVVFEVLDVEELIIFDNENGEVVLKIFKDFVCWN